MFISFITKYLLLLSVVTLDSSNVVFFYLITVFKSEGYREFFFALKPFNTKTTIISTIWWYMLLYTVITVIYCYISLYICSISGIGFTFYVNPFYYLRKWLKLWYPVVYTVIYSYLVIYTVISCNGYYIIYLSYLLYCYIYIIIKTLFTPTSQLSFICL